MSTGWSEDDPAHWMDANDLWGAIKRFGCLQEPLDYIQFRRIGSRGNENAAVGLQMFVTEDVDRVMDSTGSIGWASSVVLSPRDARRMAAALLDAADEADDSFQHTLLKEDDLGDA